MGLRSNKMTNKASLDSVIENMDFQSVETSSFYNKKTSEIKTVSEEEMRMAESEVNTEKLPNWIQDAVKIAKEVLYNNTWISLPSSFEINEYSIMEEFCLSIENDRISNIMYDSLKGSGAFRRFKENIQRYNIEDNWYNFKNDAMKKIAINWCERNDIDYE